MRFLAYALCGAALIPSLPAQQGKPFTLQQIMSAPYANQLTAAPTGTLFAWVEDAEGRHNLYIGGKNIPARSLTHNTADDAQDIRQLAWSPDANLIAYTYGAESGADGQPANPAHLQRPTPLTVIVQPVHTAAPPVVIDEGHSPLFSHDGRSLFYIHNGQIWIACVSVTANKTHCHSVATAEESASSPVMAALSAHQLVYDRGSASELTLSPDGTTLAYISRRREINEPSHSFLALYSLTTHTLTFPAPSTGDDFAPAWSPDGTHLAWLREPFLAADTAEFALNRVSANPWSIQLLNLASNTTRKLYAPKPNQPGSTLPIPDDNDPYLLWSADDRLVFYSEAGGWDHLYELDTQSTKPPVLLTPGNFEVEGATIDKRTGVILYAANTSPNSVDELAIDTREIWAIHPADNRPVALHHNAIETHPTGDAALISSDRYPMQPAVDTSIGWHTLTTSLIPAGYPAHSLVTPQQVLFPSTDDLQIHGQLFLPAHFDAAKKHAAIIFMHGGPRRQMLLGYPAMEYYSNAYAMNQYLTSRGFIVLSVNYRCGIGYGLDFRQCAGEGATGAKEYNDILAAQHYLAARPDVDAKRIGLWGGSYGGYLTALALARNSDLFAAGVDFHGVHEWNLEDNASDWKRGDNATQDAIAAEALKSSPLGDISHWRSPVLFIHGDDDPSVAYAQTPRLADALRARNASLPKDQQVDVETLIFPDEVHEFLLHKTWLAAYTAAAAFFERTLKP